MKPSMLIICFSHISADARVLKQVRAFASRYQLTTCGFGPAPVAGVQHVELDPGAPVDGRIAQRFMPRLDRALSRAGVFRWTYWRIPYVREAARKLRGRRFDVVLADDVDTVPVALRVARPGRLHVDLHEFFPGIHDDATEESRRQTAYLTFLVRRYATRATSATTVGQGIADAYLKYGIQCGVVTNATPRMDLTPGKVTAPIRLVHSGNAQPSRQLEIIMHAVAATTADVTLDLLLMPNDIAYLERLKVLAGELGATINVLDPVPQSVLVETLNHYDVGVHVLPPTSFNNENALPNKFFDYVQARLGVIIGPSPEMARVLQKYGFGAIADGFDAEAVRRALDALSAAQVEDWKRHADLASSDLSAERQIELWVQAVARLVAA